MHKNTLQIKSIIIIGFVIIGYMLFNLAVSVYKDYQVNLRLKRYGEENLRIANDNQRKRDEYNYFNSDLFKDKSDSKQSETPIWPYLIMIFLLLLIADVAVRKLLNLSGG